MTVTTRAHHFTNSGITAAEARAIIGRQYHERAGVFRQTEVSLQVTEKSGTADMSVDVAEGSAIVKGSEASTQGFYLVDSTGTVNVSVAAADPTNARKDLIVVRVKDQDYSSGSPSTNTATVEAVTGTPAGSPVVPTVPDNCVVLAIVDVAASASTVVNANITDARWNGYATNNNQDNGSAAAMGVQSVGLSTARPQAPAVGMEFFETDTERRVRWDGANWVGDGVAVEYTPTISPWSSYTETFKYSRVGDTITVQFKLTVSATATGTVQFSLPALADTDFQAETGFGIVFAVDASASTRWTGVVRLEGSANFTIYPASNAGVTSGNFWNNTRPFTWAASDEITGSFTYFADN